MDKQRLERFRHQLDNLRGRLSPDVASIAEGTREGSTGQAEGQLSNVPLHLGDMGTEEYLYDLNATLLENEAFMLGEVLEALDRIDDGSYGKCLDCGRSIAIERLEAIPYARHCIHCAEKERVPEEANLNKGRPTGPTDMPSGSARTPSE